MTSIRPSENEARRLAEQARLDRLKTPSQRNRLGQFATPPALALDIAAYARRVWDDRRGPVRFLEPALGSGAFYSALRSAFPPEMIGLCDGVELDPTFAGLARALWEPSGLSVRAGDFIEEARPPVGRRYNLVLANPPYVRHHHIDTERKGLLRDRVARELGIEVSGLAGLYSYFLLLCDAWMEADGLGCWLIPSEFMDVNYGSSLREYLAERVRLIRIHRFAPDDVQFCDALVTSAVVVFEKARPSPDHSVEMSLGGSLAAPKLSEAVPISALKDCNKWSRFPGAHHSATGPGHVPRLGDFFDIKRGLATGANSFFIVGDDLAQRCEIPRDFLKPILPSPRNLRHSIVEADERGMPLLEGACWLIDCDRTEADLRRDHPSFWAYLERGLDRKIHEGYLASRRSPWYSQERRPPSPFLCTYMGRPGAGRGPFRFIWNKSAATASNVWLLLYPKGGLGRAIEARPDLRGRVFEFLQGIKGEHFLDEGRVYGGGLHKMEPKELARIPAESLVTALGDVAGLRASVSEASRRSGDRRSGSRRRGSLGPTLPLDFDDNIT